MDTENETLTSTIVSVTTDLTSTTMSMPLNNTIGTVPPKEDVEEMLLTALILGGVAFLVGLVMLSLIAMAVRDLRQKNETKLARTVRSVVRIMSRKGRSTQRSRTSKEEDPTEGQLPQDNASTRTSSTEEVEDIYSKANQPDQMLVTVSTGSSSTTSSSKLPPLSIETIEKHVVREMSVDASGGQIYIPQYASFTEVPEDAVTEPTCFRIIILQQLCRFTNNGQKTLCTPVIQVDKGDDTMLQHPIQIHMALLPGRYIRDYMTVEYSPQKAIGLSASKETEECSLPFTKLIRSKEDSHGDPPSFQITKIEEQKFVTITTRRMGTFRCTMDSNKKRISASALVFGRFNMRGDIKEYWVKYYLLDGHCLLHDVKRFIQERELDEPLASSEIEIRLPQVKDTSVDGIKCTVLADDAWTIMTETSASKSIQFGDIPFCYCNSCTEKNSCIIGFETSTPRARQFTGQIKFEVLSEPGESEYQNINTLKHGEEAYSNIELLQTGKNNPRNANTTSTLLRSATLNPDRQRDLVLSLGKLPILKPVHWNKIRILNSYLDRRWSTSADCDNLRTKLGLDPDSFSSAETITSNHIYELLLVYATKDDCSLDNLHTCLKELGRRDAADIVNEVIMKEKGGFC